MKILVQETQVPVQFRLSSSPSRFEGQDQINLQLSVAGILIRHEWYGSTRICRELDILVSEIVPLFGAIPGFCLTPTGKRILDQYKDADHPVHCEGGLYYTQAEIFTFASNADYLQPLSDLIIRLFHERQVPDFWIKHPA